MKDNTNQIKPFYLQRSFRKVFFLICLASIGLITILILLNRISITAENIKSAKEEGISETEIADLAFLETELQHYQEKIDDLNNLFASDDEVIQFFQELERLKDEGVIKSYSFLSDESVADKTGSMGFPVSVVMEGSKEQVGAALSNIQNLPFLLRGVQTDMKLEINDEGLEIITLNYGGFLYVQENQGN